MRTHGTLSKWNDDRGFGFISPAGGGAELFVHVSAFPRDGGRPMVGELVSYDTETGPEGKLRAVRIMRPGQRARHRPARRERDEAHSSRLAESVIAILVFVGIVGYAYRQMHKPGP
jgi:cold shock CspA family protein